MLLLSSRGDRLVDARCTDALAAAWGLKPRVHPWAGHDLPLDDPDWTIRQVRQWLSESTPTDTAPEMAGLSAENGLTFAK